MKSTEQKQRFNKTRTWFFEKINKIDRPLAKLTKGHKDNMQINKVKNEKGNMTTEVEEIKKKKKKHQILLPKPLFNNTRKPR